MENTTTVPKADNIVTAVVSIYAMYFLWLLLQIGGARCLAHNEFIYKNSYLQKIIKFQKLTGKGLHKLEKL